MKVAGPEPKGPQCEARIPCLDWIELNVLAREAEKLVGTELYDRASSAPPKVAPSSNARQTD
jgi:hypothetical protein